MSIAAYPLVVLGALGFGIGSAARGRSPVQSPLGIIDLRPIARPVPREYFGVHIHRAIAGPDGAKAAWPSFVFGSWRLWDAYVSWADLQPTAHEWRFDRLDSLVALAQAKHVAVYLTLGRTPRWASSRPTERSAYGLGQQAPPADIATWTRYVDTVSKRYRGRISAYEIWNEPNMSGFFSGSVDELVALAAAAYPTIKHADPRALVISPSTSGGIRGVEWLSRYLSRGGAPFTDVVGFHPYATNEQPEAMLDPLLSAERLAKSTRGGLPLWVTEIGWFIQNSDNSVLPGRARGAVDATVLNDTVAAAYVARALMLSRCTGVDRVMWYAWDNRRMGLTESDLRTPKTAARGYESAISWLEGNTVRRCQRDSLGRWRVSISTPGGDSLTAAWNDMDGSTRSKSPSARTSAIGDIRENATRDRLLRAGMPFVSRPPRVTLPR